MLGLKPLDVGIEKKGSDAVREREFQKKQAERAAVRPKRPEGKETARQQAAQQQSGQQAAAQASAETVTQASASKIVHNQKVDARYAHYVAEQNNNRITADARTFVLVVISALMMAVNLKSFVNQGDLLPGGINGLSVLIQRVSDTFFGIAIPFSAISLPLNALPALLAFRTVGRKFTIFSCLCIVLMSFFTDAIPSFAFTADPLLIAVFGGLINGTALSLALNAGASTGGSDFIAMYFSVKKGISTWNYVLAFNACLILISGALFGMDSALYTIIFQFCQTQVLNTLYKRYSKKSVMIVTDKPEEVSDEIMAVTHHGTTLWKAEGAYTHADHYMIYAIVSASDVQQMRRHVRLVDEAAFINVMSSDAVTGRFYLKPID